MGKRFTDMEQTAVVENFTEDSLKKLLVTLEKRVDENQKARIKHADDPNKFALSETELFATLNELQGVAAQSELFKVIANRKTTITALLNLINHENTDISAKVLHMLQEFTDPDDVEDRDQPIGMVHSIVKGGAMDIIVPNLSRLDAKVDEENQALVNSLEIIDRITKIVPEQVLTQLPKLIRWIISQFHTSEFNPVNGSAADLLATLLTYSIDAKHTLREIGGIHKLLQVIAHYRKNFPTVADEHEYMETIINCLCLSILGCDPNREYIYDEEGIELIELILREKNDAVKKSNIKFAVVKFLDHLLTTAKDHDPTVTKCCEKFIEIFGLRVIFPFFNKPKLLVNETIKKRELGEVIKDIEEHTSLILLALLKHCRNQEYIQRILIKFAEEKFSKFSRLIKLHDKYFPIVQRVRDEYEELDPCEDDEYELKDKLADTLNKSRSILYAVDYIILLIYYLSDQFETYDPNSGEILNKHFGKMMDRRPELKHQIVLEAMEHMKKLAPGSATQLSLELLLQNFQELELNLEPEPSKPKNRDSNKAAKLSRK